MGLDNGLCIRRNEKSMNIYDKIKCFEDYWDKKTTKTTSKFVTGGSATTSDLASQEPSEASKITLKRRSSAKTSLRL